MEELPSDVREKVLEKYRDWNTADMEWWDSTYEDAKRIGALMGISIDEIAFSGFGSQGDGACFYGHYKHEPEAVAKVREELRDERVIAIAEELAVLQVTFLLQHGQPFACNIQLGSGQYCHSGVMSTEIPDNLFQDVPYEALEPVDAKVQALMRRFADWIYHQLEAECEYLESDECVMESLKANGLRFNLDGERI